MKTNLFNTNYSAPEMKVIEVELEGMLCTSDTVIEGQGGMAGVTLHRDDEKDWI